MALTGGQVGKIYVDVIVNTKAAEAQARALAQAAKDNAEALKEQLDSAKDLQDLIKENTQWTKKQQEQALKDHKLGKIMSKEEIKRLEEELAKEQEVSKKQERLANKRKVQAEMVQKHLSNKLIRFQDYSGRLIEDESRNFNEHQQKKLADYQSFLHRASSEHSRFVTRLDQRDMTASTTENLRRGFEKGLIVSAKWHKDENGIQRVARGIGMASGSLQKMKDDSEMAMAAFQSLQRVGYAMQAAIGTLAGTIGSLGGGLMALIGVAGQAAYSLVAVGSAFASMGAGMIAAKIALSGVGQAVSAMLDPQKKLQGALRNTKKLLRDLRFEAEEAALSEEEAAINLEKAREELARVQDLPPDSRVRRETELQYQQAELNYRRAKARNEDARKAIKKPLAGGTVDPLAALTSSQKDFAKYLVSLKPKLDELKEAAASGFLPILQTSIQTIMTKAFPTLKSGLHTLGQAMGNLSKSFADALTLPRNIKGLEEFFASSKPFIEAFGRAAGNALGGVLGLLRAAQPLTYRFVRWLEDLSVKFEMWGNSPGLRKFLDLAGDVAASLGGVFSSVFGGLKNIMDATFPGGNIEAGAGGIVLHWLKGIADGFKAFTGNRDFATWLQGATQNATTALSSIGSLLKPIFDIAALPEIGQFWTILKSAAEPIKKMLEDGAKAAPAFGNLLVSVVTMFSKLSDSGALETFFNTLGGIANLISGVLEFLKPVLDYVGRIHGVFLAVGLAIIVGRAAFMVFAGITKTIFLTIGKTAQVLQTMNVHAIVAHNRFSALRDAGNGVWKSMTGVANQYIVMNKMSAATRRESQLLQMAREAGVAETEVQKLEQAINEVIIAQGKLGSKGRFDKQFVTSEALASMSGPINPKTGKPYGKNTQKAKQYRAQQVVIQDLAGGAPRDARDTGVRGRVRGGLRNLRDDISGKSGRRFSGYAGGRAATGLMGATSMLGSMAMTGGSSALTNTLGTISSVTAMIPGPIGLLASAATGIGTAISAGFDAAANAEKQKKAEKLAIIAREAVINVEKEKKIAGESLQYQKTGLGIVEATNVAVREAAQGVDVAAKYKVSDVKGEDGKVVQTAADVVGGFRQAFNDAGFAKNFAKDDKISNTLLEAAANYSRYSGVTDPTLITEAVLEVYNRKEGGGLAGLRADIADTAGKKLTSVNGQQGVYTEEQLGTSPDQLRAKAKEILVKYESDYTALIHSRDAGGDPTKVKALEDKIAAAKAQITTGIYQELLGPEGKSYTGASGFGLPAGKLPSLFGPPKNAAIDGTLPVSSVVPGANAAVTGPTGKVGDEININDPNTKGLVPVLTKLANTTPTVVVMQIKNASELANEFKRLGIQAKT